MGLRVRLAVAALVLAACATPWDPPGLRTRQAELARFPEHRLFDATPYLLPVRGELIEFFCRWPADGPIPVALPADATSEEQRALDAALAAWEAAGLGVSFERIAAGEPGDEDGALRRGITLEFLDPARTARAEGTGYTLADCRLASLAPGALAGGRLPAQLERARIRIVRRETDTWDERDHRHFAGEVAGVALHELAHALGFQGHARFGGGILAPDTKESTAVGRALLRGEAFRPPPTLGALYALPSGVVLARRPVPRARTAPLDDRIASRAAGEGAFVRVGDRNGRIFWREPDGREHGVTLASAATARARPERLVLLPD